jgi:predicted nucleic acid-binding protein
MQFMNVVVDAVPIVSVITKIEVLGFNAPPEHYILLTSFMNDATIIDLIPTVIDQSIELRKQYKIKLPDAIIAATAMVYNLTLITRNIKDFEGVPGLKIIDPHFLA